MSTRMIEKSQIKVLHVLASKLALTDGEYRAMLAGYPNAWNDGYAESSKHLSHEDARKLIAELEKRAIAQGVWQKPSGRSAREGITTNSRGAGMYRGIMASPHQIDMMEALWSLVSRVEEANARAKAFDVFLHKRFHRGGIRMVERAMVHKIVKALEAMVEQKLEKEQKNAER